jgi:hypothetical protein
MTAKGIAGVCCLRSSSSPSVASLACQILAGVGLEILFGLTIDDPWKKVALPCKQRSPSPLASNAKSELPEKGNRCRMRV